MCWGDSDNAINFRPCILPHRVYRQRDKVMLLTRHSNNLSTRRHKFFYFISSSRSPKFWLTFFPLTVDLRVPKSMHRYHLSSLFFIYILVICVMLYFITSYMYVVLYIFWYLFPHSLMNPIVGHKMYC